LIAASGSVERVGQAACALTRPAWASIFRPRRCSAPKTCGRADFQCGCRLLRIPRPWPPVRSRSRVGIGTGDRCL